MLSAFTTTTPSSYTTLPLSLSFKYMYSILLLLTFVPLLPSSYLHLMRFASTCSVLSQQITISGNSHQKCQSDLVHQPVCHLYKQESVQSWSLLQSQIQFKAICHFYCTPYHCYSPHLYPASPHILLYHSGLLLQYHNSSLSTIS